MNTFALKDMPDQTINCQVALCLGWRWNEQDGKPIVKGVPMVWMLDPGTNWTGATIPPGYATDLNAIAKAEALLTSDEHGEYAHLLSKTEIVVDDDGKEFKTTLFDEYGWYGLLRATARQRAIAFVETIRKRGPMPCLTATKS